MALLAVLLTWTQALLPASCESGVAMSDMSGNHATSHQNPASHEKHPVQDPNCAVGQLPGTCIGGTSLPQADILRFIAVVRSTNAHVRSSTATPRIFASKAFHPPKS